MGSPVSGVGSPKPGILSLRERRIIRNIIFFVVISRVFLMARSEEKIYSRPYLEDSFYIFNCAEHFARGDGFTCDGTQPTNGVQPLIVILYTPVFLLAGGDKILALRLGFILIALFDSFSVIFIAKLIRTLQKKTDEENALWKSPPIIAAFLWATLYPIFTHTANGLETGIYSTLLLAGLYYYARLSRERSAGTVIPIYQWIWLGILLGFTVLARIDAVFLVICIAAYEWYRFRGKGFTSGSIISFFAFAVSSPWWWYNYKLFGTVMPQSGISEALEQGILAENLRRGAIVIGDIFTVFFFLPNYELPPWFHFVWPVLVGAVVFQIVRKLHLHEYLKTTCDISSFTPYCFFCASLFIYYIFFFSAPHFIPRYFHPFRILWLILFACTVPEIIRRLQLLYAGKKKFVLIGLWVFALAVGGFGIPRYVYYFVIQKYTDFYYAGKFALAHPNEKIGMEQSGTAGFIAANVINLDGKVNYKALDAIKKNDIGAYIESEKLDYIADWREFSGPIVASAAKHGGKFKEIDSIGRVSVFKREK